MTTSTTTAGTTMRAIIQENYGEAENVGQERTEQPVRRDMDSVPAV